MTDWESLPIEELVASVLSGGTPRAGDPRYYAESGTPFLKIYDISRSASRFVDQAEQSITNFALTESAAQIFPAGTVLVTMYGTMGVTKTLRTPMATNQAIAALVPPFRCDPNYLAHALSFRRAGLEALAAQTTQPNISGTIIRRFRLPVPPLEEQRRIAEILDTIDETIQATERIIAKLWSEQVGAMEEQLATIDDQHRHRSLLDVVSLRSGQVDPRVEPYASWILVAPDHILGDGRGRLIAQDSAKAQGAISGKYQFEAGNVVYSKIRPELRKAWLATFDGLCSADMYPLSPAPGLLGGYLASVILGQRFSRFAASVSGRSSGMPKVNRRELAEFRIALPRLEVQQAIASLAKSYERRIDTETAILHKTIEARKGLAADLLSGRVRTVAA